MFQVHAYVPSIFSVEIPVRAGVSFFVRDDFESMGPEGYTIVTNWTIEIFSC